MKGDKIYYFKRGPFYVLNRAYHAESGLILPNYTCPIGVYPDRDIITDFITLTVDGIMTIKRAYAWDGPSGITFNTKSTMRTSLLHDAPFQLFRLKLLNLKWFSKVNDNLRKFGIEDGMFEWRAKLWTSHIVQIGMKKVATDYKAEKEIIAP